MGSFLAWWACLRIVVKPTFLGNVGVLFFQCFPPDSGNGSKVLSPQATPTCWWNWKMHKSATLCCSLFPVPCPATAGHTEKKISHWGRGEKLQERKHCQCCFEALPSPHKLPLKWCQDIEGKMSICQWAGRLVAAMDFQCHCRQNGASPRGPAPLQRPMEKSFHLKNGWDGRDHRKTPLIKRVTYHNIMKVTRQAWRIVSKLFSQLWALGSCMMMQRILQHIPADVNNGIVISICPNCCLNKILCMLCCQLLPHQPTELELIDWLNSESIKTGIVFLIQKHFMASINIGSPLTGDCCFEWVTILSSTCTFGSA